MIILKIIGFVIACYLIVKFFVWLAKGTQIKPKSVDEVCDVPCQTCPDGNCDEFEAEMQKFFGGFNGSPMVVQEKFVAKKKVAKKATKKVTKKKVK
jgi:hypothetical protein